MDKTPECRECLLKAQCAICGTVLCERTKEAELICNAAGRWPPTGEKPGQPFCKYCYVRCFEA